MTPGGIRVTAVSALASFLVILVAGFLASIGHAPSTGSSGTEIVSFVRDNRGALLAAIFLYSVAFALFLCFAAGLSAFLWQAERGLGGLPSAIGLGAAALVALAEQPLRTGVHHIAGAGSCSWNELALEVFDRARIDCRVLAATSEQFPRPATRPAYSVLGTERSDAIELAPWREGVAAYLATRLATPSHPRSSGDSG